MAPRGADPRMHRPASPRRRRRLRVSVVGRRRLAEAGHRVIALDHPGYGHGSRAPWTASQEHVLGDVEQLTRALELERFAIGGLSMGAGA
ncbi:MAG: alpha/beta fold hydrolase [Agrococcus sp.]